MVRFQRKKKVSAIRVGIKIGITVLGLYVGGYFISTIGNVMNGTCSPFYKGLELIGWTVATYSGGGNAADCDGSAYNLDTSSSNSTILAVVGIIAIASIVFEFVDVQW